MVQHVPVIMCNLGKCIYFSRGICSFRGEYAFVCACITVGSSCIFVCACILMECTCIFTPACVLFECMCIRYIQFTLMRVSRKYAGLIDEYIPKVHMMTGTRCTIFGASLHIANVHLQITKSQFL